jgi:signal transduction histidine kinase
MLLVIECLAFTAIFAFLATNPMYAFEVGKVQPVHEAFRIIVALAAVMGLMGILVLTRNLLEFMAASDEFIELDRLATLGKFSAWAAHQIRNPLAIIRGQAQVLSLQSQDNSIRKACTLIMKQSDKISDLLALMMTLSQPVLLHKEQIDIRAMLSDILEPYIDAYPRIAFSYKGFIEGVVLGHPRLLEEAFKNVITNAIESMDGAGRVEVVCSENDRTVTIRICDSGTGISDEALRSAFEIGFTTKKYGTGLGLSIVRTILNSHQGSVSIDRVR